jgi:hypothetical protein
MAPEGPGRRKRASDLPSIHEGDDDHRGLSPDGLKPPTMAPVVLVAERVRRCAHCERRIKKGKRYVLLGSTPLHMHWQPYYKRMTQIPR